MLTILAALTFLILGFAFLAAAPIQAVCPVCTVAIGGGVLLSHYLGVDDLIIGIWAGGLTLSFGLWMATAKYLKRFDFRGFKWLLSAFLWITTVLSLKQTGFIGHPTCKIHGHDKLLSGIIFGSVAFLLGYGTDFLLRKLNKKEPGKALFPYQRVVAPLFFLIFATAFAFQLCRLGIK
ncbi:MAG TPA: hypothetical protein VMW04_02245 [Patescibacteria group bacterium]|nr:hypothetical protein [Patescibacteria group bacterium]